MLAQYIVLAAIFLQSCVSANLFISNGHEALAHQYPYQVVIYAKSKVPIIGKDRPICGGVILASRWILTSAQCFPKLTKLSIKAGKHNLTATEYGQEVRFVKWHIVHKKFKAPSRFNKLPQNDIALLKLNKALTFNENITPIILPKFNEKHNGIGFLSGWGGVNNLNISEVLQSVKVPFLDSVTCTEIIKSFYKVTIPNEQICTGPISSNITACSIDIGGPVVQFQGNGKPQLVGLVTWFDTPCAANGLPTVYTRVSSYVNWINSILKNVKYV